MFHLSKERTKEGGFKALFQDRKHLKILRAWTKWEFHKRKIENLADEEKLWA